MASETLTYLRNYAKAQTVVIKGVKGHPRVANERGVLRRFQNRTPYIRPLIDEIEESSAPPTIVLKHLGDHLLSASAQRALNQREIRYVSKRVLEALAVLHDEGYVHTGTLLELTHGCGRERLLPSCKGLRALIITKI